MLCEVLRIVWWLRSNVQHRFHLIIVIYLLNNAITPILKCCENSRPPQDVGPRTGRRLQPSARRGSVVLRSRRCCGRWRWWRWRQNLWTLPWTNPCWRGWRAGSWARSPTTTTPPYWWAKTYPRASATTRPPTPQSTWWTGWPTRGGRAPPEPTWAFWGTACYDKTLRPSSWSTWNR